jgi:hypothetical protein
MSEAVVLGRSRGNAEGLCSWSRPNTTLRGHNAGFIWKYPLYDTFINQWLKITVVFLFFRCGPNYPADQDLIRLHDDLIQVLLILTSPFITYWQSNKSLIFILHVFQYYYLNIKILKFYESWNIWNFKKKLKSYENFEFLNSFNFLIFWNFLNFEILWKLWNF